MSSTLVIWCAPRAISRGRMLEHGRCPPYVAPFLWFDVLVLAVEEGFDLVEPAAHVDAGPGVRVPFQPG